MVDADWWKRRFKIAHIHRSAEHVVLKWQQRDGCLFGYLSHTLLCSILEKNTYFVYRRWSVSGLSVSGKISKLLVGGFIIGHFVQEQPGKK